DAAGSGVLRPRAARARAAVRRRLLVLARPQAVGPAVTMQSRCGLRLVAAKVSDPARRGFLRRALTQSLALPAASALTSALARGQTQRSSAHLVHHFESPQLELVRLLREACTVEHALMLQYLYAAFSIRPAYAELAGAAAPGAHDLIGVAIQEMQ